MLKKYILVMILALILAVATIGTVSAHLDRVSNGDNVFANGVPGGPCQHKSDPDGTETGTVVFNHHTNKEMCMKR